MISIMKKLLAAAGAIGLSLGLAGAGVGPASAKESDHAVAVCEHRLCLFVLKHAADSDGDGFTDLDEDVLGYDSRNPRDHPEVKEVLDMAIARELPSFERHLTELIALPRDTPEGDALATAFGAVKKPERGDYVTSVKGLLGELGANGFENLGTNMTATLTRKPDLNLHEKLEFAGLGNVALYGELGDRGFKIEGLVGPTSFGLNGQKTPTGIFEERFIYGNGGASFGRDYMVGYEDGSRDHVSSTSFKQSKSSTTTETKQTSHDADGRASGFVVMTHTENKFNVESGGFRNTQSSGSHSSVGHGQGTKKSLVEWSSTKTTFPDGSTSSHSKSTVKNWDERGNLTDETVSTTVESGGKTKTREVTTTYGEDGKVTGKTETTSETDENGKTTTTTTVYDADGNVVDSKTTETSPPPCEGSDCPENGTSPDSIPNAENTGMGPITGDDLARVAARLNSLINPSRDDYGDIEVNEGDLPPQGANPLVAMFNPDGVVSFAVGVTPAFNWAQPRYDPDLHDIIDVSGVNPPKGTEPVSWPNQP